MTYWFAGLKYLDVIKVNRDGTTRHEPDVPGTLGYGWCASIAKGVLATEIGFSGGEGYLFFANIGVQWSPEHRTR